MMPHEHDGILDPSQIRRLRAIVHLTRCQRPCLARRREHLREAARLARAIVGGDVQHECEQAATQEFFARLHIKFADYDDDDRDTILECACRLLAQEFATTLRKENQPWPPPRGVTVVTHRP
jgi:hypothetical protein